MIFRTYDQGGNLHVADLRGLYHGAKAAFLVGGAPSLREQPYRLLEQRGVLTFAMNNVGGLFRPTCMVASDEMACFDRRLLLDPTIQKFLWMAHSDKPFRMPDGSEGRLRDIPNAFLYDAVLRRRDSSLLSDTNYLDWKRNTFFLGISVMYHLGIRTIVLAGSDFGPDDRGRDYSAGSSLTSKEKAWNEILYKYEAADMLRLKGVFDSYGLRILDSSAHSKLCPPAGPYERISLEDGVSLCLEGFPAEHDKDPPHVSRLHDPRLADQVIAGRYNVVHESDTLYKKDIRCDMDLPDKQKAIPVAPIA